MFSFCCFEDDILMKRRETLCDECFFIFVQDRVPGEPFVAKPSKDAEMDKIMRSMQVSSAVFKAGME